MKKAVIVDDNTNNMLLEKDLLEVAGFEVHEANDAASGIALIRKERPDIIIMDVRLPDMLGTEAARIIRLDEETGRIPIVFVTASVMAGNHTEINKFPNSGLISKPIDTRTFARNISRFVTAGSFNPDAVSGC